MFENVFDSLRRVCDVFIDPIVLFSFVLNSLLKAVILTFMPGMELIESSGQ